MQKWFDSITWLVQTRSLSSTRLPFQFTFPTFGISLGTQIISTACCCCSYCGWCYRTCSYCCSIEFVVLIKWIKCSLTAKLDLRFKALPHAHTHAHTHTHTHLHIHSHATHVCAVVVTAPCVAWLHVYEAYNWN